MKKYTYVLCALALVGWVAFRFSAIGSEKSRDVFNAARVAQEQGLPVDVLEIHKKTDALKEPLFVKSNRAYVSISRVDKFKVGQVVGDGKITFVSSGIDMDSGMYIIRTSGVTDGLNYADAKGTGFFVPVYAINNGTVMVSVDGVAQRRDIKVTAVDSETALVSSGLDDGDFIVLSKVDSGEKIKF